MGGRRPSRACVSWFSCCVTVNESICVSVLWTLLSVGGLVLVLTMGTTINGSRSWLELGGLSIQPSEFAKLAVVIGKSGKHIARARAHEHVAGYTVANDYAIRDYLENYERPNLRVKNRDTCTPIGPWLVDAADLPDPSNLDLARQMLAYGRPIPLAEIIGKIDAVTVESARADAVAAVTLLDALASRRSGMVGHASGAGPLFRRASLPLGRPHLSQGGGGRVALFHHVR